MTAGAQDSPEPPHALTAEDGSDLPDVLARLGIPRGRPVLAVVGGAGGMSPDDETALVRLVAEHLVPQILRAGAVVVDGGTDAGVMRVMGGARAAAGDGFPLVGVATARTVRVPGVAPAVDDPAELERRHSAVVLTPGDAWGAESPWLARVATLVADGAPSATLVVNGGEITYRDIAASLDAGRPVIVVGGTGRTADALAAAAAGTAGDDRDAGLVRSPLVRVVQLHDPQAAAEVVAGVLAADAVPPR
jgi:hypothetical protein